MQGDATTPRCSVRTIPLGAVGVEVDWPATPPGLPRHLGLERKGRLACRRLHLLARAAVAGEGTTGRLLLRARGRHARLLLHLEHVLLLLLLLGLLWHLLLLGHLLWLAVGGGILSHSDRLLRVRTPRPSVQHASPRAHVGPWLSLLLRLLLLLLLLHGLLLLLNGLLLLILHWGTTAARRHLETRATRRLVPAPLQRRHACV